jgi:hypothetical protein
MGLGADIVTESITLVTPIDQFAMRVIACFRQLTVTPKVGVRDERRVQPMPRLGYPPICVLSTSLRISPARMFS